MNTKLLKQVANRIVRYPEQYDQNDCRKCIAYHAEIIDPSQDHFFSLPWQIICKVRFWPKRFKEAYRNATSARGRARVGYRRIMAFIKSEGKI